METQIQLGDIEADVTLKNIKNIHLSVYPPTGRVRIAAPSHMNLDTIRVFALAKLGWIKRQRQKMHDQERETPREYLERESHYVWGQRYLLKIIESDQSPSVDLQPTQMVLKVRPGTDSAKMETLVETWYREQLKQAVPPLIAKWAPLMAVEVAQFFVQRMKTKWGSCNPVARNIRLNTELAKKPPCCLEYIIVHEMTHMIEPTHNTRFVSLMDYFMPQWKLYRDQLNRLPVRHENWIY